MPSLYLVGLHPLLTVVLLSQTMQLNILPMLVEHGQHLLMVLMHQQVQL
jgi:hypothetical protein